MTLPFHHHQKPTTISTSTVDQVRSFSYLFRSSLPLISPHKTPTKKVTKKLENPENLSLATYSQDLFSHLFPASNRNSTTVQLQYSIQHIRQATLFRDYSSDTRLHSINTCHKQFSNLFGITLPPLFLRDGRLESQYQPA
jgi:hypothetical protein